MKDKLKKYLLPNLPYLFFVYLFVSAPVIKCKKTPRKKCRFVAERRKKR